MKIAEELQMLAQRAVRFKKPDYMEAHMRCRLGEIKAPTAYCWGEGTSCETREVRNGRAVHIKNKVKKNTTTRHYGWVSGHAMIGADVDRKRMVSWLATKLRTPVQNIIFSKSFMSQPPGIDQGTAYAKFSVRDPMLEGFHMANNDSNSILFGDLRTAPPSFDEPEKLAHRALLYDISFSKTDLTISESLFTDRVNTTNRYGVLSYHPVSPLLAGLCTTGYAAEWRAVMGLSYGVQTCKNFANLVDSLSTANDENSMKAIFSKKTNVPEYSKARPVHDFIVKILSGVKLDIAVNDLSKILSTQLPSLLEWNHRASTRISKGPLVLPNDFISDPVTGNPVHVSAFPTATAADVLVDGRKLVEEVHKLTHHAVKTPYLRFVTDAEKHDLSLNPVDWYQYGAPAITTLKSLLRSGDTTSTEEPPNTSCVAVEFETSPQVATGAVLYSLANPRWGSNDRYARLIYKLNLL